MNTKHDQELAELRSDLTAAEEQVRFAKEIIAETRVQRDALRAERDELKEALEHYANAEDDTGVARAALARCEKGGDNPEAGV